MIPNTLRRRTSARRRTRSCPARSALCPGGTRTEPGHGAHHGPFGPCVSAGRLAQADAPVEGSRPRKHCPWAQPLAGWSHAQASSGTAFPLCTVSPHPVLWLSLSPRARQGRALQDRGVPAHGARRTHRRRLVDAAGGQAGSVGGRPCPGSGASRPGPPSSCRGCTGRPRSGRAGRARTTHTTSLTPGCTTT